MRHRLGQSDGPSIASIRDDIVTRGAARPTVDRLSPSDKQLSRFRIIMESVSIVNGAHPVLASGAGTNCIYTAQSVHGVNHDKHHTHVQVTQCVQWYIVTSKVQVSLLCSARVSRSFNYEPCSP